MPSVSILIPCYNAERWVAQAIQSALDQTHADKEVIVVDDGSTDCSLEVIKSFGDQIRWETGPNRGGNVARNRLLELSSGEWLQYLDADDYLLPDKVRGQLGEFDWEEVDVAFAPITMEYYQTDGSSYREALPILNDSDPWNLLIRWELPQTGGPIWRRDAIIEVGKWKEDQNCCQEHELYYRLLENHKRFHRCEKSGAIYRVWSDDSVCRRNPMQTNMNRMEVVDRCEQHLRTNEQLNATHRAAIAGQRLQIARSIYSVDRRKAVELAAHARGVDGIFESCAANVTPRLYRIAFQLFGFQTAERLAELSRSIKKLVPTSANRS